MLVDKRWQRKVFFKKFSSKCIYRDVKCSFCNPAEKRLPVERFFSCQSPQKKWKLKYFFKEDFSSNCSYGNVENTIDNLIEKKRQKAKTFSLSVRKRKKKFKTFFRKIYLSKFSCKHVESGSGSPVSIFLTKRRKIFTQCPEMIKIFDGFFCQTSWKNVDWMPKSICSVCENYENYLIFSQKNLFNMIPWTRRKQFSQPCRKVFARGLKVFRSFVKTLRTPTIFSKKSYFLPRFPVDMWNSVLAILLEVFWPKTEKNCSINNNDKEMYTFFKKKLR